MHPLSDGLLSLPRPGNETDVPLVASSPWVRMVPRVHGVVTEEKPPAAAGPLSRIGEYLRAARRPGLLLWSVHCQQHKGNDE
jgi:hypothetical protein